MDASSYFMMTTYPSVIFKYSQNVKALSDAISIVTAISRNPLPENWSACQMKIFESGLFTPNVTFCAECVPWSTNLHDENCFAQSAVPKGSNPQQDYTTHMERRLANCSSLPLFIFTFISIYVTVFCYFLWYAQ